jgi:hypothetical protein
MLRAAKEILALGKDPINQSTCILRPVSIASMASQVLNGGVTLNTYVVRSYNKNGGSFYRCFYLMRCLIMFHMHANRTKIGLFAHAIQYGTRSI